MTTHKQNPFGLLEHSDSEDDETQTKTRQRKPVAKDNKPTATATKLSKYSISNSDLKFEYLNSFQNIF